MEEGGRVIQREVREVERTRCFLKSVLVLGRS